MPPNDPRAVPAVIAAWYMQMVAMITALFTSDWYYNQPYHTSALTGAAWVKELLTGHPDRIRNELGMRLEVFIEFVYELRRTCGLQDSRYGITVEEQAAIFLYMMVTGLNTRHTGERFQHSHTTISYYFRIVLDAVSSPPFYTKHVQLPKDGDQPHSYLRDNPKFWPFFEGCDGAVDGSHITSAPTAAERHSHRDRKGTILQNVLACTSFDFRFVYIMSGWEGAAADSSMYNEARFRDLPVRNGHYYLADAGFGFCDSLLIPYRGTRYHLHEWGRVGQRPENKEELFNLRHAQAQNIVKRIFGVIKKRFAVLTRPVKFSLDWQARIPAAAAALHNFIMKWDPSDLDRIFREAEAEGDSLEDEQPGIEAGNEEHGRLADRRTSRAEQQRARAKRDHIAQDMWDGYIAELRARGDHAYLEYLRTQCGQNV